MVHGQETPRGRLVPSPGRRPHGAATENTPCCVRLGPTSLTPGDCLASTLALLGLRGPRRGHRSPLFSVAGGSAKPAGATVIGASEVPWRFQRGPSSCRAQCGGRLRSLEPGLPTSAGAARAWCRAQPLPSTAPRTDGRKDRGFPWSRPEAHAGAAPPDMCFLAWI